MTAIKPERNDTNILSDDISLVFTTIRIMTSKLIKLRKTETNVSKAHLIFYNEMLFLLNYYFNSERK